MSFCGGEGASFLSLSLWIGYVSRASRAAPRRYTAACEVRLELAQFCTAHHRPDLLPQHEQLRHWSERLRIFLIDDLQRLRDGGVSVSAELALGPFSSQLLSPLRRRTPTACQVRTCWREERCLSPERQPANKGRWLRSLDGSRSPRFPIAHRLLERDIEVAGPVRDPVEGRAACGSSSGSSSGSSRAGGSLLLDWDCRWNSAAERHHRREVGLGHGVGHAGSLTLDLRWEVGAWESGSDGERVRGKREREPEVPLARTLSFLVRAGRKLSAATLWRFR